jgi:hypothetical protein
VYQMEMCEPLNRERGAVSVSSTFVGSLRSSAVRYAKTAKAAASCSSSGSSRSLLIASSSTRVIRWGIQYVLELRRVTPRMTTRCRSA